MNVGLLGGGRLVSFPHVNKISAMLGQSIACSCTHKRYEYILKLDEEDMLDAMTNQLHPTVFLSSHKSQT